MKVWVVLNDIQLRFHDKKVLKLVLWFLKKVIKPHGVLLNGDIWDCYEASDFDKNPMRPSTLAGEIADGKQLMQDLLECCRELRVHGGNHEDRWRRLIWRRVPCIAALKETSFEEIFGLKKLKVPYKEYGEGTWLGNLYVTHGDIVRKHSGYSAKAHFDKYGVSIMHGHTHRGGTYYHRNMKGIHGAWENFCLCRLDPEYVKNPDWQQGFSIVYVEKKFFHVEQLEILPGPSIMYGGKLYK